VPDEAIGNKIGVFSDSRLIQSSVEGIISLRRAREGLVKRIKDGTQIEKITTILEKKRQHIEKMMATAGF